MRKCSFYKFLLLLASLSLAACDVIVPLPDELSVVGQQQVDDEVLPPPPPPLSAIRENVSSVSL